MKSAKSRMDIISAYRQIGRYRDTAELSGTTHKYIKRVVGQFEAGDDSHLSVLNAPALRHRGQPRPAREPVTRRSCAKHSYRQSDLVDEFHAPHPRPLSKDGLLRLDSKDQVVDLLLSTSLVTLRDGHDVSIGRKLDRRSHCGDSLR